MSSKVIPYLIVAILVGCSVYLGNAILSNSSQEPSPQEVAALRAQLANLTKNLTALNTVANSLRANLTLLSKSSLANKTVRLAYLAYNSTASWDNKRFIEEIIEPDINEYTSKLGYNLRFEFVTELVKDMMTMSRKISEIKGRGIDLVIVGNGNAGADVTLSYATINGMVLVSSTSNQTDFARGERDRLPLFRICPVVKYQGSALADLMWEKGVRAVVVLQRGDSWGDATFYDFLSAWESLGGVIVGEKIRYAATTTDFSNYFKILDEEVALALQEPGLLEGSVGLLAICREEATLVVKQAEGYSNLFNVTWYGADFTANNKKLADLAGSQAAKVKWISTKPEFPKSESYTSLSSRCLALTGKSIDIYSAYLYDSAFLLARSVIEAQSIEGLRIASIFQRVSNSTFGISGWCGLDLNKDRIPPPYEVWSYVKTSNTTTPILLGVFEPKHTHAQPVSDADMVFIINDVLRTAISPRMPGYGELIRGGDYVVLSNSVLDVSWVSPAIGGYRVVVMTPLEIRQKADSEGSFYFLQFEEIRVIDGIVELEIMNAPQLADWSQPTINNGGALGLEYVRAKSGWVGTITMVLTH